MRLSANGNVGSNFFRIFLKRDEMSLKSEIYFSELSPMHLSANGNVGSDFSEFFLNLL